MKRTHLAAFIGVPMALLLLSAQPLVAAPPAHSTADANALVQPAAKARFGAKLTTDLFPQNAGPAHTCEEAAPCTWAMNTAIDRVNGAAAPKDGTLGKIRVIGANAGHFKLQFVKVKNGKWSVAKNGPMIYYTGQPDTATAGGDVVIDTTSVTIPIKKGWHLAARAASISALYCNSGSPNVYQFQPPLVKGDSARTPDDHDGCYLLVEAEYK